MTRTHSKFVRPYAGGYAWGGSANSIGTVGVSYDTAIGSAYTDNIKNILIGQASIKLDGINGFMSPLAAASGTGFHEYFSGTPADTAVLIAIGVLAAPAQGCPVFAWQFQQSGYFSEESNNFVASNVKFGGVSQSAPRGYDTSWGYLLHAEGAETAANTATGVDDYGASTALGGTFHYQLLSSNGTVTLKAQHAATNSDGSFADLTGATSGSINASVTPVGGMVACAATQSVNRYLRWQLAFGTATTATFVCSFHRRIHI